MVKLVITRGAPASGKTTAANIWVAEDPTNRTRISRDDIRINIFNMKPEQGVLDSAGEGRVSKIQRELVETLLMIGVSVAIDDTNLRQSVAQSWADLAAIRKVEFEVIDFTHVPVEECIRRDMERGARGDRMVGAKIINDFHTRYLKNGTLNNVLVKTDLPSQLYVPDTSLPSAYIFDVDGTLAIMDRALRNPYDWHKVHLDTVNKPVYDLYKALSLNNEIIVMSGRDSGCRAQTETWLADNDIQYSGLFMRAAGDNRKDTVIKAELFFNEVAPKWNVLATVDDRSVVCAGWRALGMTCFQVAPGDF